MSSSPVLGKISRFNAFLSSAEPLLKGLSLAGIGVYALGLLVTNTYLAKYATTDFALLKPECFFTGTWALVLLLLAGLPFFPLVWLFMRKESQGPLTRRIIVGFFSLVAFSYFSSLLAWLLFLLIGSPIPESDDAFSFLKFDIGVPGWRHLLALMTALQFFFFFSLSSSRARQAIRDNWRRVYIVVGVPLALAGALLIGREIYGNVNAEAGGGRPYKAFFYFSPEGADVLKQIRQETMHFHDPDPNSAASQVEGDLIYLGSDRYVFGIEYCPRGDRPLEFLAKHPEWCFYKDRYPNRCLDYPLIVRPVIVDKKLIQAIFPTGKFAFPTKSNCPWQNPESLNR